MPHLSRRDIVIGASAAMAAFGLARPVAFIGAAEAQRAPTPGFFKYKVGDVEAVAVYDGLWEKAHDPAFIANAGVDDTKAALKAAGLDDAFVPIPFTITALNIAGEVVLIDAGTGGQTGGPKAGLMMANLAAAGIDTKTVKKVLISHFHPDHIYGLMARDTNAQVFPDAEIIVPANEYNFWTDAGLPGRLHEARRGLVERIQKTFPSWGNVKSAEVDTEVAPGVRMIPTPGHTPGHVSFHVASGSQQLIVLGDTSNLPALFVRHPDWHGVFDMDGNLAEASRRKIYDQVVADKTMVSGYHFGMPNVGRIARDGAAYAFTPVSA